MKTLPVQWTTFVARRRLNIKEWLAANEITNYQSLVKLLTERGIEPPLEKDTKGYFRTRKPNELKPKAKLNPLKSLTSEAFDGKTASKEEEKPEKKSTKKRRGRPKKVHNSSDE